MKVQLITRMTGNRTVEKGLVLGSPDVQLITVLEKIEELNDVIDDVKYGRMLIGHGDSSQFIDVTFGKLLDIEGDDLDDEVEDFALTEAFGEDEYDIQCIIGLLKNKPLN